MSPCHASTFQITTRMPSPFPSPYPPTQSQQREPPFLHPVTQAKSTVHLLISFLSRMSCNPASSPPSQLLSATGGHLPSTSTRIKSHALLQCWPSTPPERSSRWRAEMRHSILSKTSRTGFHIVRCSQETVSPVWFLHFLVSKKILKSFMVLPAPVTSSDSHEICRNLLQKIRAWLYVYPLHQNHIYTFPPIFLE